jgi:hypothetical protein
MDCTTSPKPARPINVSIGSRPLDGRHSQPGDARTISGDLNNQYGSPGSLPPRELTPVSPNRVEWNITLNDWVAQVSGVPCATLHIHCFSATREGWMLAHQGNNGSRISDIAATAGFRTLQKGQMKKGRRLLARIFGAGESAAEAVADHYFRLGDFEQALIWQTRAEWFVRARLGIR